jgi:polyhydroxyalkanoate synthesis regulator phasin
VKLSKTLVLPIAGLLVVVGAGAVLASTATPGTTGVGGPIAPAADTPTPTPAATSPAPAPWTDRKSLATDSVISSVLDDLVAKGTITAEQKTAILDALQAKRDSLRADRQAAADALRQQLQQIRGFLSDGQITQDELDQLPADSPLRQLTNLMDDGKITTDELRSIGGGILRDLGLGRGRGFGPRQLGGGPWGLPNATPAPSPSSGTSG